MNMNFDEIGREHSERSTVNNMESACHDETACLMADKTVQAVFAAAGKAVVEGALPGVEINGIKNLGKAMAEGGNITGLGSSVPADRSETSYRSQSPEATGSHSAESRGESGSRPGGVRPTSIAELQAGKKLEDSKDLSPDTVESKNLAVSIERQGKMDQATLDTLESALSKGKLNDKIDQINKALEAKNSKFRLSTKAYHGPSGDGDSAEIRLLKRSYWGGNEGPLLTRVYTPAITELKQVAKIEPKWKHVDSIAPYLAR